VVVALALLVVVELVWRGGVFSGTHIRAEPRSWTPWRAPIVEPSAQQQELDRLMSLGYPIRCGGGNQRLVALTFDDGPGPYTAKTLRLLRKGGARATFFIVGRELVDWPNLAHMPRHELKAGALGDHTWDHPSLPGLSQDQLDEEIGRTQQAVARASGAPVKLFRPPYGATDAAVDRTVRSLGMVEVLWTVDSGDSVATSWHQVLADVMEGLKPGAIILMHENRGTTLNALPTIIHRIAQRGYRMVSVPELLAADPPSEDQLRNGTCP
jgi:peptidoglycan/xylan/chitin deacetylase (PgdA/CDA1 family)